jgi:hypothetical protein
MPLSRYINLPMKKLAHTISMKSATSLASLPGKHRHDSFSVHKMNRDFGRSELIFSDSPYPINDFMLGTIASEVQQNVRRINRHPSNAQWAGGNEVFWEVPIHNKLDLNSILLQIEGIVEGLSIHFRDEVFHLVLYVSWSLTTTWYSSCSCSRTFCMMLFSRRLPQSLIRIVRRLLVRMHTEPRK